MWKKLWSIIQGVILKLVGSKNISQALNIQPVLSSKMENAIELWGKMYEDKAPWLKEPSYADPVKIVSLGIPAFIASEKARSVTLEMVTAITAPDADVQDKDRIITKNFVPTNRAEFLNKQYQLYLLPHIRRQLEYGIAKGGLIIKPYIFNNEEIKFTFCQADEFYPISFDTTGQITEAAFTETFVSQNNKYTRVEYHKLDMKKKQVTVVNKAYKTIFNDAYSSGNDDLGVEISLSEVPQWEILAPTVTVNNVDRLMFAYFKMPDANTIDTKSPLGVSGYSRAVNLIKEADLQFSRLAWEYEGGELAVDIDNDALKTNLVTKNGRTEKIELPNIMQKRLYRKIDLGTEDTYKVYNPTLRDSNYIIGLNNILMRIEDETGLSRGTLSDITRSEAKTATELLLMRQRSYSTVADIQKALQIALEDVIYVMNALTTLYNLFADGEYSTSFEWDDSLISSPDEELQRRLNLKNAGLESRLNIRMWYFGETREQAEKQLEQIDKEQKENAERQAISTGLVGSSGLSLAEKQTPLRQEAKKNTEEEKEDATDKE